MTKAKEVLQCININIMECKFIYAKNIIKE